MLSFYKQHLKRIRLVFLPEKLGKIKKNLIYMQKDSSLGKKQVSKKDEDLAAALRKNLQRRKTVKKSPKVLKTDE